MTDLKPCPSCGHPSEIKRDHGRDHSETWIHCTFCPLGTIRREWAVSDESVAGALVFAWTRRTPIVVDDAMVERAFEAARKVWLTTHVRGQLRAALEAALNPQEKPE